MSVLIKGMEMPTSCYDCPLAMQDYTTLFGKKLSRTTNSYACVLTHKSITSTKRNRFCPLVPAPPHGRLGDLDKLYKKMEHYSDNEGATGYQDDTFILRDSVLYVIEDAPTIIPAEEGKHERKTGA